MTARYRAFRFVHPDLEPSPAARGLRVDSTGDLEMVEDDAAISQAIRLLVTTRPGERVMRPEFGCDLQRLVFSPNDDTTAGLAIHYVRRAIETWEPRVEILRLEAARDADGASIEIILEYRVRATQRRNRLSIGFSLDGGAS